MAAGEHSSKRRKISVSASASLGSSESLIPGLIDDVALNCLALVSRLDYPSLSCVNKTYNKLIKSGNLLSLRKTLEYIVFMLCHPKGWVMFSPMQNKWLALPKIPNDKFLKRRYQNSLAVDDELLVFGADFFMFTIWKFSLRSWCWVKCKDMRCPRWLFASGSLGGKAIVAGGIGMYLNELASAELYDPLTGRWEMLPNMHIPRSACSGFFMDGKFYVVGGILDCGEEFDLETRKWRKVEGMNPNMNRELVTPSFFAVVNDELFILGYRSYIVKKYDKANNKWEAMGRLPPRMVDSIYFRGIEIKACGDQLLVFCKEAGGGNGERIVVNSWCPKSEVKDGNLDLKVIGTKVNFGVYSYTNTLMGC